MVQDISGIQTFSASELIAASTIQKASGSLAGQELTTRSTGFKVAEWIVGVLTLGIGAIPFEIYKSFKENQSVELSTDVVNLKNTLFTFKEGEATEKKAILHGERITLQQDCNNRLTAKFEDGRTIDVPFGAFKLAEKLNKDIVSHADFYGGAAALKVLLPHVKNKESTASARALYLSAMEAALGENLGNVTTIKTKYLGVLACKAIAGQLKDAHALDRFITQLQRPDNINAEDCLDLLHCLEQAEMQDSTSIAKSVILPKLDYTSKELEAQDPKITQVRNFVADIIYDKDTWIHDDTTMPGQRLYKTLKKHTETVLLIYNNKKLLSEAQLPDPIKEELDGVFNNFLFRSVLYMGGADGLPKLLDTALSTGQLATAEERIDASLEDAGPTVQETIANVLDTMLPGADEVVEDHDLEPQGNQPLGTGALAQAEKSRKKMDAMLEASATDVNSPGYGKFMKESILRYFSDQAPIDKRAMLSASIRYATATSTKSALLGALLKGAGPIMQKMLQGFNTANMDPIFADALSDMKTNLAPIHEQIVKAQLYGMVQDSKGSIVKIEVVKSLGAASVGQAFLCKVTTPQKDEPVDCVIKLLRPDVKARADRERKIFENVAKEIPGMEVTFAGQLQRIMDELDLTKEAKNIEVSSVYEKSPFKNVHSMQSFPLIDASPTSLALEKAPGVTIDTFYRTGKARIEELLSDSKNATSTVGLEKINTLLEMYTELGKLQGALQNSAMAWVSEGIFGGGFYHGDLHAGNMMFDKDHGLTMIDYGNATSLTPTQQSNITLMMAAATAGDTQKFLKGYRDLLSPDGLIAFDLQKKALTAELDTIMSLGKMQDTGKRIALCLTAAAKMGIESPGPIFNFSQCQLRLQGTIDSMNEYGDTLIKSIANVLADIKWETEGNKVQNLTGEPLTKESILQWNELECIDIYADSLVELHNENPDAAQPWEKEVIALRDITNKIADAIRPQVTFTDCMADVLLENLGATMRRVGLDGMTAMQRAQAAQDLVEEREAQENRQLVQEKLDMEFAREIEKNNQGGAQIPQTTEVLDKQQPLLKEPQQE